MAVYQDSIAKELAYVWNHAEVSVIVQSLRWTPAALIPSSASVAAESSVQFSRERLRAGPPRP